MHISRHAGFQIITFGHRARSEDTLLFETKNQEMNKMFSKNLNILAVWCAVFSQIFIQECEGKT